MFFLLFYFHLDSKSNTASYVVWFREACLKKITCIVVPHSDSSITLWMKIWSWKCRNYQGVLIDIHRMQNTGLGIKKQFLILSQTLKAHFINLDKNFSLCSSLICKNIHIKIHRLSLAQRVRIEEAQHVFVNWRILFTVLWNFNQFSNKKSSPWIKWMLIIFICFSPIWVLSKTDSRSQHNEEK